MLSSSGKAVINGPLVAWKGWKKDNGLEMKVNNNNAGLKTFLILAKQVTELVFLLKTKFINREF